MEAAYHALPSLIGMPVNYDTKFNKHNIKNKCGVVTKAYIDDNKLMIDGFLYARDYPDVIKRLQGTERFGFSFDAADAQIKDQRKTVWEMVEITFVGATLLLADSAAYKKTSIQLLEEQP